MCLCWVYKWLLCIGQSCIVVCCVLSMLGDIGEDSLVFFLYLKQLYEIK
jgi:hypothetical protein